MNLKKTIRIKSVKINLDIFLTNVLFIFMIFISGLNSNNSDFILGYYVPYNDLSKNHFEIGFYFLNLLGRFFGLDFFFFRFVLILITLLLIRNFILRYSKDKFLIALLYLFFPFLIQCVQIRHALATAIIIFAIRYLEDGKKNNLLKYIFFVLIASSIHSVSIFYMCLILAKIKSVGKIFKLSSIILGVSYISVTMFKKEILNFAYRFIQDDRIFIYVDLNKNYFILKGMLPYLILGILFIYMFYIKINKVKYYSINKSDLLLFKISIVLLAFLPLYLIDGNYSRIWSFMLPVLFCALINLSKYSHFIIQERILLPLACIFLSIVLFFFNLSTYNMDSFNKVTKPVITNNVLWEWLGNYY